MTTSRRILPAAVFILLLATFLRFHLLAAQSFWNDEGNSARLSERSIPAIIEGTASDVHPPLYYLLLRGWRELVGETEFGLRALSAFAGVMTVAAAMALGRMASAGRQQVRGARRRTADYEPSTTGAQRSVACSLSPALAGLIAAVSPVLVYYSQETRMYALLALLASLSAWVLWIWLSGRGGTNRSRAWAAAYTLLLAAGLYTHYFFPAVIVAQGVAVALWLFAPNVAGAGRRSGHRMRRALTWAGLAVLAAALYLPWVPTFLRQIGGRAGVAVEITTFLRESGRWLVLGSTVAPGGLSWAVIAAFSLLIVGAAVGGRRAVIPFVLVAVPLALMAAVGATDPAFFKFALVAVPFLAVIMGLAWKIDRRQTKENSLQPPAKGHRPVARALTSLLTVALTVAVLAGSLASLGNLYTDPTFARADYRGMAARIAADGHSNAGIILNAPNQWEAFTYYHRDGAPVYPLPRGQPDPAIVEPELERIATAHDRLYVLYWGEAQRDPQGVIERWLDAHTYKASEEWVGDVRFAVYAVPRETTAAPTPSGAPFAGLAGETITLHEYTVWPTTAQPGDVIQVRLVWSADRTPARPYKVFLHLRDTADVVAQRDGEPGGGSRPTTGWQPGEHIVDNHGILLPAGLPPGEYALWMGLYDAFDPDVRLPVAGADGIGLGTVIVGEGSDSP